MEGYEAPAAANVKNVHMHLTNYSVNKKSSKFVVNTNAARDDEVAREGVREVAWCAHAARFVDISPR